MSRKLFLLAALGLFCGTTAAVADDAKPGKGKLDKGKLFDKMDADGNGKVTKEEFKKWAEGAKAKLQAAGKGEKLGGTLGEKLFEKLDANGDGEVTKEEFEKFELPAAGKGKFKGKKGDPE